MGNFEFLQVLREDQPQEDTELIRAAFNNFDVHECDCCVLADKLKLLTIIHTAFGSMDSFNDTVRTILEDVAERHESVRTILDDVGERHVPHDYGSSLSSTSSSSS